MNQSEAIKALAEWLGQSYSETFSENDSVLPGTRNFSNPRLEYLRLLSANVAAIVGFHQAPNIGIVIREATTLTHATIQSLAANVSKSPDLFTVERFREPTENDDTEEPPDATEG